MTVSLPALVALLASSILPAAGPPSAGCAGLALCGPAFVIQVRGGGMGGGGQGMGGGMGGGGQGMGGGGQGMGGGMGWGRGADPLWNDAGPSAASTAGGSKHWRRCVTPAGSCSAAVAGAPEKGTPCYCPSALGEGRLQ